jgi:hypothetical protein
MTVNERECSELRDLLWSMEEGTISVDGVDRIDRLVRDNAELLRLYVKCTQQMSDLRFGPANHRVEMTLSRLFSGTDAASEGEQVGDSTSCSEKPRVLTTSHTHLASLTSSNTGFNNTIGFFSSGWPVAYLVATVIFAIGLAVGARTYVSHSAQIAVQSPRAAQGQSQPERELESVGRITGMVDCQWEGSGFRVQGAADSGQQSACSGQNSAGRQPRSTNHYPLSTIRLGDKFALSSGLMEITYDSGAKVILQGPVTYEVESPTGGYLSVGKLTAKLEKRSASASQKSEILNHKSLPPVPCPLFAVRTPTAVVTDLGTEFGLEVTKDGNTMSHVYRGSVRLQVASSDGTLQGANRVLHENESARVEKSRHQNGGDCTIVPDSSARKVAFVREIPKRSTKTLDLADVVAGGDGFSGRRNRGIDPRNGRLLDVRPPEHPLLGDGAYHRVVGMPFVDGVFIPHAAGVPVQVDSAGHRFAEFSASENRTDGLVFAGREGADSAELDGIDYSSPGHTVLALHANKGITFDLDAIRRANPGWKTVRFRSVAGNAERNSENGGSVHADLWVLVDGQVRFKRRDFNRFSGPAPVAIPIDDANRFLTLVAADGGDGIGFDWTIFGDPRLELTSVEPNMQSAAEGR